jgi:hypothetical protein
MYETKKQLILFNFIRRQIMTMKKVCRPALVCCLVFLCTCVRGTEELEMAWMKKVSLQGATVAAVAGDDSGCTLVTGGTTEDFGPEYPNLGQRDAYLSKYNPDGELMWVYPLGTERTDSSRCLTVDAEGNCFVGGQTYGSLAPNLIEDSEDTRPDAFLAKISSEGICRSSVKECRTVIDEHSRIYSNVVHLSWEAMYLNVITAVGFSIRITPVETAVVRNATRATLRRGSKADIRNSCRYRITM